MAGKDWSEDAAVTWWRDMEEEPFRFDFFDSMRRIERTLGRCEIVPATPLDALDDEQTASPTRFPTSASPTPPTPWCAPTPAG